MTRIYISGPITGIKNLNYEAFEKAYDKLRVIDNIVINPHWIHGNVAKSWTGYMITDIEHLMPCDTIYMLKGWIWSKGARLERRIARDFGMKIIYERPCFFFRSKL